MKCAELSRNTKDMIIPPVSKEKQGVFLCPNNRYPYLTVGLGRVFRGSGVHFNVVIAAQPVLGAVGEPFVPYPCVHVLERLGQRTVSRIPRGLPAVGHSYPQ